MKQLCYQWTCSPYDQYARIFIQEFERSFKLPLPPRLNLHYLVDSIPIVITVTFEEIFET